MSTHRIRRGWPALVAGAVVAGGLAIASGSPTVAVAATATTPPPVAPTPVPEVADGRLLVGLADGVTAADGRAIARRRGREWSRGRRRADTRGRPARRRARSGAHRRATTGPAGALRRAELPGVGRPIHPERPVFPVALLAARRDRPGGIRAESAWNTTLGSRDVVVGVLDSGIDTTPSRPRRQPLDQPDRHRSAAVTGPTASTRFANTCAPEDDNGHGTHVAGIIGAVGNNGIGVTGVAPRASLMALKMLDHNGDGSIAGAIQAIDWAIGAKQAGVDLRVLSASWGGGVNSEALRGRHRSGRRRRDAVRDRGRQRRPGTSTRPAGVPVRATRSPNVVCVAATGQPNDALAEFSDFGADQRRPRRAREGASSRRCRRGLSGCAGLYCAFDGTSMATPMVSGTAVLAIAERSEPVGGGAADPDSPGGRRRSRAGRQGRDRRSPQRVQGRSRMRWGRGRPSDDRPCRGR